MDREYLIYLRLVLRNRFNQSELRDLCFDLGVDYEDLPGNGRADKARELVAYLDRRNQIPGLVTAGRRVRPDIDWGEELADEGPEPGWISPTEGEDLTGDSAKSLETLARKGQVTASKKGGRWALDQQTVWWRARGWVGTREASEQVGYSQGHIRRLAKEGRVKARKVRGQWLLNEDSLLAYYESRHGS